MKIYLISCVILVLTTIGNSVAADRDDGQHATAETVEYVSQVLDVMRPNWNGETRKAFVGVLRKTMADVNQVGVKIEGSRLKVLREQIPSLIDSHPNANPNQIEIQVILSELRWCMVDFLVRPTSEGGQAIDHSKQISADIDQLIHSVRDTMQASMVGLNAAWVDLAVTRLRGRFVAMQQQPLSPLFKKPLTAQQVQEVLANWTHRTERIRDISFVGQNSAAQRKYANAVADKLMKSLWWVTSPGDLRLAIQQLNLEENRRNDEWFTQNARSASLQAEWSTRLETIETWLYVIEILHSLPEIMEEPTE